MKKTLFRILKVLIVLILILGVAVVVLLKTSWAQSYLANSLAKSFTKELGCEMSIGKVHIDLFTSVALDEVFIADLNGDTLIHIPTLKADIDYFGRNERRIDIGTITLNRPYVNLYKEKGGDIQNIDFLVDYFKGDGGKNTWSVTCNQLHLSNGRFRSNNYNDLPQTDRLDLMHLSFEKIDASISDFQMTDGPISCQIDALSMTMNDRLEISKLKAEAEFMSDRFVFKDAEIETPLSSLSTSLELRFSELSDFRDFKTKVPISAFISESEISLADIAQFTPTYNGMNEKIGFKGVMRGTIEDLSVSDFEIYFGDHSTARGEAKFTGLPRVEETFFDIDIHRYIGSISELKELPVPNIEEYLTDIEPSLNEIGNFVLDATFTGFLNDFVLQGHFDSELGTIDANVALVRGVNEGENMIKGTVKSQELDIGTLLGQENLAGLHADLEIDARGNDWQSMMADVRGFISQVEFRGYTYKEILIDGRLEEDLFNGELSINQEEISLDFSGLVDLRSETPRFDFDADIYHADINALKFSSDRDSTSLTGRFDAEFSGDDADNFIGRIDVLGLSYCEGQDEFYFEDFHIKSSKVAGKRDISLRSNQLDMDLSGYFKVQEALNDVQLIFSDALPALYDSTLVSSDNTKIELHAILKEPEQIAQIFVPGWGVGPDAELNFELDMEKRTLNAKVKVDSLTNQDALVRGIDVELVKEGELAYLAVENQQFSWQDSLNLKDNFLTLSAQNDEFETDFTWSLVNYQSSGSFSLVGKVFSLQEAVMKLNPSQLIISDNYWMTNGVTSMRYDDGRVFIDSLEVTNGQERIFGHGEISSNPDSEFFFDIENFELEHLNKFLPEALFTLDGKTNVKGVAKDILNSFSIESDMTVEDLFLGGEEMGDLRLGSHWNRGESALNLLGGLAKESEETVTFEGSYFPNSKEQRLDAKLNFDSFDLTLLNRLNTTAFSDIQGNADGKLTVTGDFLEPLITGELTLSHASVHFNYLNTTYSFENEVKIREDWIGFDHMPFRDEFGNQGFANGTVLHENYRNWNYDIFTDFEELLVLNTSANKANPLYHGTVFATGELSVSGYDDKVDIEVTGKTEPGTTFELPLGGAEEVKLDEFVTFYDPTIITEEENPLDLSGVALEMNIEATPDAQMKIVFDEQIGDVIEGNGQGNLTLSFSRDEELSMFGRYVIYEGDYLFTLQNVIAKDFDIERGGTIEFFGDPYEAELNINTVYSVRTSLYDIILENPEAHRNRVPVLVEMGLTGELQNPDIDFDIELPSVNPDIENIVKSRMSTEQEKNEQVFALLVLQRFLPPDNAASESGSNVVTTTGSEFVSSQLSNWLSQISQDVDIGVNYRPGDNITSEELAVALTTQLFNDRLLFTGNLGVQTTGVDATDNRASSIIGDFILEYMITPDGQLRLKVFNESNDFDYLNADQSLNTQGIGLIFQREFDGLFDDRKRVARSLGQNLSD